MHLQVVSLRRAQQAVEVKNEEGGLVGLGLDIQYTVVLRVFVPRRIFRIPPQNSQLELTFLDRKNS